VVPRIQFEELGSMSSGGGLAHSYSNMSLSGALLSDGHTVRMSTTNGEPLNFRRVVVYSLLRKGFTTLSEPRVCFIVQASTAFAPTTATAPVVPQRPALCRK
jgi:hypothetical protein